MAIDVTRTELLLAILAAPSGGGFTPVQLQKSVYLITKNLTLPISGQLYDFQPYDYGPFDSHVYRDAEDLRDNGFVRIDNAGRSRYYSVTSEGKLRGSELLFSLDTRARDYITRTVEWVRKQSFTGLVRAIYKMDPDMRRNSIFQD